MRLFAEERIAKPEAENLYLKGEFEFIKKLEVSAKEKLTDKRTSSLTFALIEKLSAKQKRSVSLFWRFTRVSHSGYYAYKNSSFRTKEMEREFVLKKILKKRLPFETRRTAHVQLE